MRNATMPQITVALVRSKIVIQLGCALLTRPQHCRLRTSELPDRALAHFNFAYCIADAKKKLTRHVFFAFSNPKLVSCRRCVADTTIQMNSKSATKRLSLMVF